MARTVFKGDMVKVSTRDGEFKVTGFTMTHIFARDKHGVVYRFKKGNVTESRTTLTPSR